MTQEHSRHRTLGNRLYHGPMVQRAVLMGAVLVVNYVCLEAIGRLTLELFDCDRNGLALFVPRILIAGFLTLTIREWVYRSERSESSLVGVGTAWFVAFVLIVSVPPILRDLGTSAKPPPGVPVPGLLSTGSILSMLSAINILKVDMFAPLAVLLSPLCFADRRRSRITPPLATPELTEVPQ